MNLYWLDPSHPKRCPHERVEHCPLYIIGHYGEHSTLGCVDDLAEPCRVQRNKMDYSNGCRAVAEAMGAQWMQVIRAHEQFQVQREQRARNLKAARLN